MSVLFSVHIRKFLPFLHGCKFLGVPFSRSFPISQYCSFGKKKKNINKNKSKPFFMATLGFNQLHHCRAHTRRSHGLSQSLCALAAVCELTFTRADSLGIVHSNHSGLYCWEGHQHIVENCLLGMNDRLDSMGDFASCWMKVCTRQLC